MRYEFINLVFKTSGACRGEENKKKPSYKEIVWPLWNYLLLLLSITLYLLCKFIETPTPAAVNGGWRSTPVIHIRVQSSCCSIHAKCIFNHKKHPYRQGLYLVYAKCTFLLMIILHTVIFPILHTRQWFSWEHRYRFGPAAVDPQKSIAHTWDPLWTTTTTLHHLLIIIIFGFAPHPLLDFDFNRCRSVSFPSLLFVGEIATMRK